MQIYLCDDSDSDILRLKHYLNIYAEEKNFCFEIFSFSSGQKLLEAFMQTDNKPELIFLDIYMYELNGIDTARELRRMDYSGGIIFTTSSREHAMDSYEVNALYYLQKPYDHSHFENAMTRCSSLLQKARPCFSFTLKKQKFFIPYEDIVFFETGGAHTILLHTVSNTYCFPDTLSRIAETFSWVDNFLPVGRSYVINLNYISGQLKNDLIMSDGSIVQIPLRKQEEIFDTLKKWKKEKLL